MQTFKKLKFNPLSKAQTVLGLCPAELAFDRGLNFNFLKVCIKRFHLYFVFFLLISCQSSQKINLENPIEKKIDNILKFNIPAYVDDSNRFNTTNHLPEGAYDIKAIKNKGIGFDSAGRLNLKPGDYAIPVMTFCLKYNGSSPNSHIYALNKLSGSRSEILNHLHSKGLMKYSEQQIQALSWSLQAGLKYEELGTTNRKIIDDVIPNYKANLKENSFDKLKNEWNHFASLSQGVVPNFDESVDTYLNQVSSVGKDIKNILSTREFIMTHNENYSKLEQFVNRVNNLTSAKKVETSWSQIDNRVYARFVTDQSYLGVGYVEIRVLKSSSNRGLSAEEDRVAFDLYSLVADPLNLTIQPLGFGALFGYGGVAILSAPLEAPLVGVLLIGAVLGSQYINWDDFSKLNDIYKDSRNAEIKKSLEEGYKTLQEIHDKIEKPARDAGIINDKTPDTSTKPSANVREYRNKGGAVQLEKDFAKLPGETQITKDGTVIKVLPDGSTVVKRPKETSGGTAPTIEFQDPKSNIRVKIRYEK